jgi:hypothetical protein
MKIRFTIIFILITFLAVAQANFKEFPGTGFGVVLPDSNYIYKEQGFYNKELHVTFFLMNQEADLSNLKYNEFLKMMLRDILRPGITVLSDKIVSADSSRIIKVIVNYDSTDEKPATKGAKDITWFYFYNYNQKPILLTAFYPIESDKLLGENILRSLKTFKNIDNSNSKKIFKNSFTITEDYAPLKYCGPSFGGIRLNIQGKYHFSGGDSSYCLIIPMTIPLSKSKGDSMRSYLLNRLQIHVNADVAVQSWRINNTGNYILYEMTGQTNTDRLLYLGIRSDSDGYFEIWGESYHHNTNLISVFKKISESLRRN